MRYLANIILPIYIGWGCSSNGRALALHARGNGIDAHLLHTCFFSSVG